MMPDPVGSVRVFHGAVSLVYVGMTVPMIGLDSHMMFAFTDPGSAVPHYTVDSVQNADAYAFHLDMIPRVDLGSHLGYMDHCYGPLTEIRSETLAHGRADPGRRWSPRQWALMSEWMLANHCDEATFRAITPTVDAYREQWFGLLEAGIPAALVDDVEHRAARAARRGRTARPSSTPTSTGCGPTSNGWSAPEQSESTRTLLAGAGRAAVAS